MRSNKPSNQRFTRTAAKKENDICELINTRIKDCICELIDHKKRTLQVIREYAAGKIDDHDAEIALDIANGMIDHAGYALGIHCTSVGHTVLLTMIRLPIPLKFLKTPDGVMATEDFVKSHITILEHLKIVLRNWAR